MRFSSLVDVAKVCTKCGQLKALDEYGTASQRARPGKRKPRCKPCVVSDARERYLANRELVKARSRAWNLANKGKRRVQARAAHVRRTYGLAPGAEEALLEAQGGGCAICATAIRPASEGGSRWDWAEVDHDHTTNAVRGLLCGACNRMLGHCRDEDPAVLRAAARYLEEAR